MRPLFTIHGGEYLVGSYIEQKFKHVKVWIPSRDTGIDLLVTDRRSRRNIALQVKFSKDFLKTNMGDAFQKKLRACGWWTINRNKLRASPADFWVLVLLGFDKGLPDFVIVPTAMLRFRLQLLHKSPRVIHSYLWVTVNDQCWEARGLSPKEKRCILDGSPLHSNRNFEKWLNNWSPVRRLNY